ARLSAPGPGRVHRIRRLRRPARRARAMNGPPTVLLRVKGAREQTAMRQLHEARAAVARAQQQLDAQREEYQRYRAWRPQRARAPWTPPGRRSGRRTPPGWPPSARCRRSRSCSPTGRRARSAAASAWRSWSSRNSPGRAARPATERIAPMGIRRSDHVVVRPDGTLERVASVEPSSEEQAENERLGDRFDALLQQDEPGAPAEERDARSSLLFPPTRPPWRDPAAKAPTPPEQPTVGRERDAQQPKESSKSDRAGDAPADPSADAPDASGA